MAALILDINETLHAIDDRMAVLAINMNETVHVNDERRGNFIGALSDVLVGTTDITQAAFATLLNSISAVGYGPFQAYVNGDYEYQKAVFKSALVANSGSVPRLLSLTVGIDVPDIFDRGTATTVATGVVTVPFNRAFLGVAEVTATLKGGTVIAAPRVTNVTLAGFDIELIDAANNRVAGTASWAAKGY